MPTEPPPCAWAFPPAEGAGDEGLLALGADLAPGTLLAAYRAGHLPDADRRRRARPRGSARTRAGSSRWRSSRRAARCAAPRGASPSRADRAFADVVAGCADPRRPGGWITPAIRAAYERPARARLGALDRGLGRRRHARRRALRRRDRRPVRRRVEVPPAAPTRRRWRSSRSSSGCGRRAASGCSTSSGRRRTCARSARATSRAPSTSAAPAALARRRRSEARASDRAARGSGERRPSGR